MTNRPSYMLDPHATYLVAGGLGGLGRGVARWLVQRGARYLILLSRSGPRTPEAHELLSELAREGVHVETPACDVTSRTTLRSVLASCSDRMPPVKGCIQASMVMTVRVPLFAKDILEMLTVTCRNASFNKWNFKSGKRPSIPRQEDPGTSMPSSQVAWTFSSSHPP